MLTRERTQRNPVGTGSDDRHYPWNSSQLPAERMIVRLKPVVTSGDLKKGETLSVSKKKRGWVFLPGRTFVSRESYTAVYPQEVVHRAEPLSPIEYNDTLFFRKL